MQRRRYLRTWALGATVVVAGCLARDGDRGTTDEPLDPSEVTTTSAEAVEITVAQIVIREGDEGPHVYYQLENDGSEDATVAVRTVLRVEAGGTYEATAYTDVPAGGEVFLEYPIVRYEALAPAERDAVRRGDADFDVYVNGVRTDV